MGTLASEGMVSRDQELTSLQQHAVSDQILEIQAIQWKRQLQLQGSGKDASRELAVHLIPDLSSDLRCGSHICSSFEMHLHLVRRHIIICTTQSGSDAPSVYFQAEKGSR